MIQEFKRRIPKCALSGTALLLATLLLLACGGGGGGSAAATTEDVRALSLPDRIELSKVDDGAASARARALGVNRGAYNDAGTDYTNLVKRSYVDDTDALDMINTVLGIVKDTGYENFVNKGAYKALVRNPDDSGQSQSGSATTSTTTEQLSEIYVNVTRTSNSDPMLVKIWLQVSGPGDMPMMVRGLFTVSQGVSAEYPYGVMEAHFKGNLVSDGTEVMQMALSANAENGQVVIENVDDEGIAGGWQRTRHVRVVANADVTEGNAYVSEGSSEDNNLDAPIVSQIAFDPDYFQVTEGNIAPIVYSKANLRHRIYNYKLFNAGTGAKVTRNAGFPVQTQNAQNAYVGYYGIWAPYGTTLANGDTVTDMAGNSYTIFRAGGKLTKHTASNMPISDLTGVELSKFTCDGMSCTDQVVTWNGTDTFWAIGYRGNNGQIIYYTDADQDFQAPVTFQQWEGAWCESLKAYLRLGSLYFNPNTGIATSPTNTSTVYFHAEETLDPATATNLVLNTNQFTLTCPITQAVIDNAADAENTYWQHQVETTYYFDAATMMLYRDAGHTTPVIMTDSTLDLSNTRFQGGYQIGPLTEAHYYIDQTPFFWQANDADVYYTWSTGVDEWNQYATLVDGNGAFVAFDAPISFSYTHSTAADVNGVSTFNNKIFRIEYDGFSVNIPWGFDGEPLINIADGTLMGPGDEYVIKAAEESLVMSAITDQAVLDGVSFDTQQIDAPTLTYDSTKTELVGDVPTTATLKVIKGEVLE